MKTTTKKEKLRMVFARIRKERMDSVAESIVNETDKNYDEIALEHSVSRQFVLDTAQKRSCGRKTQQEEEVSNG